MRDNTAKTAPKGMTEENEPLSAGITALFSILVVVILCVSAVCSGLNIGLISISQLELKAIETNGDFAKRQAAKRLKHIMEDRYLLLCAILIFNSLAMEVLPLLLDQLVGPTIAVILSISLILICGEIIPQAICNKYGLKIGAFCLPLLWTFVFTTFAASYPLARLLDKLLGADQICYYKRAELTYMISMHARSRLEEDGEQSDESTDSKLDAEEVKYIHGVMKASEKTVTYCLTPASEVYMLPTDAHFNRKTAEDILAHGYSRIPLYDPETRQVKAILHTKKLMELHPDDNLPICQPKAYSNVIVMNKQTRIFDALNQFQSGRGHLAVVLDQDEMFGIVTLEDVIEEILQQEIIDEDGK